MRIIPSQNSNKGFIPIVSCALPLFRGQRGAQEENIISYRDDPTVTIRTYIVENFLFSDDEGLDDDVSLLETGIIDSTGALELVVFLEEMFGFDVPDADLIPENLDSISALARYVQRKTVGAPTPVPVPEAGRGS